MDPGREGRIDGRDDVREKDGTAHLVMGSAGSRQLERVAIGPAP